jgi:Ca2+-binding EF-hand superfamily protein
VFDSKKQGFITHEQFECMLSNQQYNVELLAKGGCNLKADVLFRFYDVHSDNMISYPELIKMVSRK